MKKLNLMRYGLFEITKQVKDNDFKVHLTLYMRMYLVFNVENLKPFEPSMLNGEEEEKFLPTMKYFSLNSLEELEEDIILQKKV
jgi:hypothetical protein